MSLEHALDPVLRQPVSFEEVGGGLAVFAQYSLVRPPLKQDLYGRFSVGLACRANQVQGCVSNIILHGHRSLVLHKGGHGGAPRTTRGKKKRRATTPCAFGRCMSIQSRLQLGFGPGLDEGRDGTWSVIQ